MSKILKEIGQKINHIAIIPDGNRRWAKSRCLPPEEGHRVAFLEVTPRWLQTAWQQKIHTITLWGFSTENWKRPPAQVNHLMEIYHEFFCLILPMAKKNGVKITHLGRKDRLPSELLSVIDIIENQTRHFECHNFNFALDYGGRDEIVSAVRQILRTSPKVEDVAERFFETFLATKQQRYPDPDLIIRTSGERRWSGFMPWQSCYSEYFFINKLYPDFTSQDLTKAAIDFLERQRRFGK